jgi:hypothetical protein
MNNIKSSKLKSFRPGFIPSGALGLVCAGLTSAVLAAPPVTPGDPLCFEIPTEDLSVSGSMVYKMQFQPMGDGVYSLAGRARFLTTTEPAMETWRIVRGAAVMMPTGLEISLDTSDIMDWRSTEHAEDLHESNAHMLLDPETMSGIIHAVNISYSADPDIPPSTVNFDGNVTWTPCPF